MFRSFGTLEGGLKGFVLKRPRLFKPIIVSQLRKDPLLLSTVTNTITLTRFEAQNNANNQIPQEIEVVLDCRLIPETSTEEFLDGLHKNLNNENIEISVIRETQKAAATVPDRYYDALESALMDTYPGAGVVGILFPATTDNNYFREKGIPVYGIVPVFLSEDLLKTIHNVNERMPVQPLINGTEAFTHFLENMFKEYEELDQ